LDRPLHVVGAAEGTALGAAALGLLAVGRAGGLSEAVSRLTPAGTAPPPVVPDPALVAAYARLRSSVPDLLAASLRSLSSRVA
jgi:gluconokinase